MAASEALPAPLKLEEPPAKSSEVQSRLSGRLTGDMERGMLMQKPSSARSQEVSHVFVRTFRTLYAKQPIDQQTMQHLIESKGSEDRYHEEYVSNLEKVSYFFVFLIFIEFFICYI